MTTAPTLNTGQEVAADEFFKFLFDPGKHFLISGPAGVGKTFWMGYIIDIIMPRYHEACQLMGIEPDYTEVVMTATTNKAAEVLSKATGHDTQTIHSFMNLSVRNDFSTGKSYLTKNPRTWVIHSNMIIFIDESSMIDSDLREMIDDGTFNCKIVYVGDKDQLAPVMEKVSPVYGRGLPVYELTEQMRTNVPELQAVNQQLRDTVQTGLFNPIRIIPGIIDHLDGDQMMAQIEETFKEQTTGSRILAYTNAQVIEYNQYIREMRQLPDTYQVGELLVNNTAYIHTKDQRLAVEAEVTIVNNHGPDAVEIEPGVMMAVDILDIKFNNEMFRRVKYPTDRDHFNALSKHYAKLKLWPKVYNLKEKYPDLRPRDAATVHKSQGSTYDSVFIDLGNISTCHQADQVARMLYVAFTRARTRVFLYGNLADKYGGLIS